MLRTARAHAGAVATVVLLACCLWTCTLITDFSDPADGSVGSDGAGDPDGTVGPDGEAFRVNQLAGYFASDPRVAMGADGSFVVVWNHQITGQDSDISARVYGADGLITSEFTVNTHTEGFQVEPDVGADADGSFVVVWEGPSPDNSVLNVFSRRFDSYGNALDAADVVVHGVNQHFERVPRVALYPGAGHVVAWIDEAVGTPYEYSIHAKRFDTAGEVFGQNIVVSGPDELRRRSVALALDSASGDFTVVWSEMPAVGDDNYDIHARRYAAFGDAPWPTIAVGVNHNDQQVFPSVTMAAGGEAIIAWVTHHFAPNLLTAVQLFDTSMTPSAELPLPFDAESAARVEVAARPDGRFSAVIMGTDADLYGIYCRQFDAAGDALGSTWAVNDRTAGSQSDPALAMGPSGDFVVVWSSFDVGGTVFEEWEGIFARRFTADGNPAPAP